ncbi:Fis family sigma54 specific transcriptional regulator [Nitrosospira sp. Nsp5]|uniref:Sigma54 specific transcriptional regulator, Fis family n=1 Tax=Nitrosospira multiformis TaxID=1231 RepID=A0ABY0TI14_9PROT|nr:MULTISPECIES: sigma-54 dependent transcriptional regulator [Nitrosospira]PTR10704.1 Fis family sigma54 specific transcriptional regulator [Nitrosospira sp. Nsp5]SDQ77263.1 sigma54 specific transcriptional regulator, Fis family [Nitrosospira multiformis]
MARILIVDDDASFRESLAETVSSLGYEILIATNGAQGLSLLKHGGIEAVFLDFRLPDMTGIEVLHAIKHLPGGDGPPVIMLTAYTSVDNTIEAMKLGAFEHLAKPISRHAVETALAAALASRGTATQQAEARKEDEFVAHSERMRETIKMVGRAAASDATVLITGETGSGKEIVARALHQHSARASQPFVAVNCAAIPQELLESELFGHVRGAFTGATANRTGIFQQADGGTLLLDEIGDMSSNLQAKLLRVLAEGKIVPLGAERPLAVNVRLLAATHRDLEQEVKEGKFREDLFYRLNVINIHVSPLRERHEDIIALAEYFLALASDSPKNLSAEARHRLEKHSWPGNVRELRNVIERATILARGPSIKAEDLGLADVVASPALSATPPPLHDLPAALAQLEEAMIRTALAETGGNRAEAARRLGIRRQLLYAKLQHYGVEP